MINRFRQEAFRHARDYKALESSLLQEDTCVVSVDVFDTLLLRATKPEIQRFKEIAELWKETLGSTFSGSVRHLFNLRVVNSKLAYRHVKKVKHCREATHAGILNSILRGCGLPATLLGTLRACELEYEKQALTPNKPLVEMLVQCRKSGKRVIAISDMYLSAKDIELLIQSHLPDGLIQRTYSSADFGYGKSSGFLYESVRELEGRDNFDHWVHCGDNYHSDVYKAAELGMTAIYLPRSLLWRIVSRVRAKMSSYRLGVNFL